MFELGYALSSEEHAPNDLVSFAECAEEVGFTFALISDHFHPWLDKQGHSPFVWSTIGGIAHATRTLRLGTGVTCPIMRYHPAIVAQAAATCAAMMPGRFFLGLGSGENLNEHILGEGWPSAPVRLEMLEEAIEIIRLLWQGGEQNFDGTYFTVDHARIYTLPDEPTPIYIAAAGKKAAEMAGQQGDGLISTSPDKKVVEAFSSAGGGQKPKYGQVTVCWGSDEKAALETAKEWWASSAVPGELSQELALPRHFEQAISLVRDEDIAKSIICGPDPAKHRAAIQEFVDVGIENVYVHQVGPDQKGFFEFYRREILPAFAKR
jgi:coenzyme F420-dependent glucose-6-phosphate dehydrogenase